MILSLIFAFFSLFGNEKELRVAQDLKPLWRIIDHGKLNSYDGQAITTIHLSIDFKEKRAEFFRIQSEEVFYFFVNSALITKSKCLMLNVDSLKRNYDGHFFVSIHQAKGISDLSTQFVFYESISQYENPLRPNRAFQNFTMLALLLLIVFFTALLRSNPQLTLDYFNIIKLFSFKSRDDSPFVLRITSSVNLLFYFFCSLLTAQALLTVLHFSKGISIVIQSHFQNVGGYFVQWFLISLAVAGLLMLKLSLVGAMSLLFGWKNTAGFQFFNFTRVLVVSISVIGLVSVFCFSLEINVDYYFLMKCFCGVLSLGAVLMFFKLLNRESAGVFHLFSYLCATEIFPLVILIKVFLF